MKLWIGIVVAAIVAGCASMQQAPHVYRVAKGVYQIGRKIVIINEDMIGDDAMAKLKAIDDYAGRFDTAVGIVGKSAAAAGSSAAAATPESAGSAGGSDDGGR